MVMGMKFDGALGHDTRLGDKYSPLQIGKDNKWSSVAGGIYHSIGLKSDGTLWAWGDNSDGQLGDGTAVDKWVPVQIG